MPATEMIVSVAVLAALVLGFIHLLRLIGTAVRHRTVRRVIDRDPASAEQLLAQLGKPEEANSDERLGIIMVALGIAMAAAAVIAVDDPGLVRAGIAASLFPLIIGGALWLRHAAMQRAKRRDGGQ
jgi:hypothetical protein